MTNKTKTRVIFFIRSIGHDGGNFTGLCVCNHPAGMSMLGELQKAGMLDFAGRGIPAEQRNRETHKYIEDRIYYGDVAIGFYRFTEANIQYARKRLGKDSVRIVQRIRNPLYRFASKWSAKKKAGARCYQSLYGRAPKNEREVCEGCAAYFAQNFFERILRRAEGGEPIIRLEDINRSMKRGGGFFKRHMEWLTMTEWPQDYIQHIHDHWTPGYVSRPSLEWDDEGRVSKVQWVQNPEPRWGWRDNWDDDPRPKFQWDVKLEQWQKEVYLKYNTEVEKRLGYNQSGSGTVEDDWEFRGKFPWGDVYD